MDWLETVSFLGGCMPRGVGRALSSQPEGTVREIRVRSGGRAVLMTMRGEISCTGILTQPQVAQMAEAL